jgi:hypothetical protein
VKGLDGGLEEKAMKERQREMVKVSQGQEGAKPAVADNDHNP